jgi:hypothetical protein
MRGITENPPENIYSVNSCSGYCAVRFEDKRRRWLAFYVDPLLPMGFAPSGTWSKVLVGAR